VWDLPDYAKLIASGDFYYGNRNFPLTAGSSIFGDQKDLSLRQNIMLDMPRIFRDDLATQFSLSYTWRKRDYIGPGSTPSRHDEQAVTVINRWDWYPLTELTLRFGVDYRYSHLNSTNTGIRGRHDSGAYLTLEYKPSVDFLIIPSVKVVSDGHAIVPIPKLGLAWSPLDSFSIKNNYYRSFKFPDLEDLYWEGLGYSGNPDLKPEDGWGGDLGISYQYKNYLTLGSTFFVQWTDNSIHWSGDSGGKWRPQNVGAALFFGSENKIGISPFKDMALKKSGVFLRDTALSLSYQFLLGRLLSYGYTWGSDKRIPYMPMHTLGVSLDIPWGLGKDGRAGSVIVSGHFEALRFADTANVKKLPSHFLLNININQEINKNLAAFLAARNVLNSSYQSFDSYPMPGVTFTLGVKINYEKN
jgi:vitamin B12 transporter